MSAALGAGESLGGHHKLSHQVASYLTIHLMKVLTVVSKSAGEGGESWRHRQSGDRIQPGLIQNIYEYDRHDVLLLRL